VQAFVDLARDLVRYGAPGALVAAARGSARDERRHARMMRGLARAFGGQPRASARARVAPKTLLSLALHNAVEGCVRETYGALLNAVQGARARDAEVRAAMAAVAADELRHAALAWEIASWAEGRLSARDRRRVARARRRAVGKLAAAAVAPWPEGVRSLVGLPDAGQHVRLARGLAERLLLDFTS
jgi:hypothetical protein